MKLADQMSMKRFRLDSVFDSLNASIMLIVDHFLYLNNLLLTLQKSQKFCQQEEALMTNKSGNIMATLLEDEDGVSAATSVNFITLKQSNRVLKQFHSLTSTLVVLVTSIKNL